MNLLEINVFILWFQSEFWNDFVAMKLLFSRINEERKFEIQSKLIKATTGPHLSKAKSLNHFSLIAGRRA